MCVWLYFATLLPKDPFACCLLFLFFSWIISHTHLYPILPSALYSITPPKTKSLQSTNSRFFLSFLIGGKKSHGGGEHEEHEQEEEEEEGDEGGED